MPLRLAVAMVIGLYTTVLAGVTPLTYLGGTRLDAITSMAVDGAGYIYVAGWTESSDLPLANAWQSNPGGGVDAFVAKLTPGGKSLVYCTYLGGRGDDRAFGIALTRRATPM